jgi:hypothetical protein
MEPHYPSPTGKYVFHILPWEARMSLWVEAPRLIEANTECVLFDLTGSPWSLDAAQWRSEEHVQLQMRRYPGDHQPASFLIVVECEAKLARLEGQKGQNAVAQNAVAQNAVTLQDLEKSLETLYQQCQISS